MNKYVKVNANVDEKLLPIVVALSKHPELIISYSCQDNRTDYEKKAGRMPYGYVRFYIENRENYIKLASFMNGLSKIISCDIEILFNDGLCEGEIGFYTDDFYHDIENLAEGITLYINGLHDTRTANL